MFNRYFSKKHAYSLLTLAGLALLLAGCGGASTTTAAVGSSLSNAATATTNAIAANPATSGASSTATATLKHQPVGTADFNWDHTTHMLTVQLMLTGLAPDSVHPVHISQGNCSAANSKTTDGNLKPLYTLTSVKANAHGVVSAISEVNAPDGIPASNWYITVHNGPGLTNTAQATTLACADVVNTDTSRQAMQTAQVSFMPNDSLDQAVSGTTHFALAGHTLTVQIVASGLAPRSLHTVHIHAGSCANQGAVIYPLTTLKADLAGKATSKTVIQNVVAIPANGWYVNVHYSTDLTTQTGFDPIACGNVVLG